MSKTKKIFFTVMQISDIVGFFYCLDLKEHICCGNEYILILLRLIFILNFVYLGVLRTLGDNNE